MPNLEIHGCSIEESQRLKEELFIRSIDKPWLSDMVVTVCHDSVTDKTNKRKPFVRLVSTERGDIPQIISMLKILRMDVEYLVLKDFFKG